MYILIIAWAFLLNVIIFVQKAKFFSFYLSIKAPVCQWVSLCVFLSPNSSETANPSELKFGTMIPLGMQIVLG